MVCEMAGMLRAGNSNTSDHVLELEVPADEAVYFDMMDWNKIMRLSYIGENEADEKEFDNRYRNETIMTCNKSWLFPV